MPGKIKIQMQGVCRERRTIHRRAIRTPTAERVVYGVRPGWFEPRVEKDWTTRER